MADTRQAPRLSQLNGVGLVSGSGGQKPAVRIQVNPVELASYGLNGPPIRARGGGEAPTDAAAPTGSPSALSI